MAFDCGLYLLSEFLALVLTLRYQKSENLAQDFEQNRQIEGLPPVQPNF
jgi:hypothetical protein